MTPKHIEKKIKEQCKDELVIDEKMPMIYFCMSNKGHVGLHRSLWTKLRKGQKGGKILRKRDILWNEIIKP